MSSGFTTYTKNKMAGHVVGQAAYAEPTNFAGLSTTQPAADGTGVTEPTGGAYARVSASSTFGAPSGGVITNTSAISFPAATADWSAGATQGWVCVYDASSAGNLLYYATITVPKAVLNGDQLSLPASGLTVTLS